MKQDKVNKQINQWIHFKKTCGVFFLLLLSIITK